MIVYENLNEEQKRKLKQALNIERMTFYYLEDHNIMLLNRKEMMEYVFLDEIHKYHEAMELIESLLNIEIKSEDVGKSVSEIKLESNENIIKLSSDIYAYRTPEEV